MFNPNNLQVLSNVDPKKLEQSIASIRKDHQLKGLGDAFLKAEKCYNINAIILASIACLESDYGNSPLALKKNNLFGLDARDSLAGTDQYGSAYKTKADSVDHAGHRIGKQYIEKDPGCTWRYLGKKDIFSVGAQWSSDKEWANKVVNISNRIIKNINKECVVMSKRAFGGVGHGGKDPGACGNGLREADINLNCALAWDKEMQRHGVVTKLSRYKDENDDISEEIRECNAFNPDIAVDFHTNSGGGDGFEVLVSIVGTNSRKLGTLINEEVVKTGQNSRGVKTRKGSDGRDYFGFIRQTKCPAVITECAFIDNAKDISYIDTKAEAEIYGKAVAKACLRYLGIPYKGDSAPVAPPASNNNTNIKDGDYSGRKAKVVNVVSNDVLNVRYDRDHKSKDIGDLKPGQIVTCEYCLNGWMSIRGHKGNKGLGYVNAKYLQLI